MKLYNTTILTALPEHVLDISVTEGVTESLLEIFHLDLRQPRHSSLYYTSDPILLDHKAATYLRDRLNEYLGAYDEA